MGCKSSADEKSTSESSGEIGDLNRFHPTTFNDFPDQGNGLPLACITQAKILSANTKDFRFRVSACMLEKVLNGEIGESRVSDEFHVGGCSWRFHVVHLPTPERVGIFLAYHGRLTEQAKERSQLPEHKHKPVVVKVKLTLSNMDRERSIQGTFTACYNHKGEISMNGVALVPNDVGDDDEDLEEYWMDDGEETDKREEEEKQREEMNRCSTGEAADDSKGSTTEGSPMSPTVVNSSRWFLLHPEQGYLTQDDTLMPMNHLNEFQQEECDDRKAPGTSTGGVNNNSKNSETTTTTSSSLIQGPYVVIESLIQVSNHHLLEDELLELEDDEARKELRTHHDDVDLEAARSEFFRLGSTVDFMENLWEEEWVPQAIAFQEDEKHRWSAESVHAMTHISEEAVIVRYRLNLATLEALRDHEDKHHLHRSPEFTCSSTAWRILLQHNRKTGQLGAHLEALDLGGLDNGVRAEFSFAMCRSSEAAAMRKREDGIQRGFRCQSHFSLDEDSTGQQKKKKSSVFGRNALLPLAVLFDPDDDFQVKIDAPNSSSSCNRTMYSPLDYDVPPPSYFATREDVTPPYIVLEVLLTIPGLQPMLEALGGVSRQNSFAGPAFGGDVAGPTSTPPTVFVNNNTKDSSVGGGGDCMNYSFGQAVSAQIPHSQTTAEFPSLDDESSKATAVDYGTDTSEAVDDTRQPAPQRKFLFLMTTTRPAFLLHLIDKEQHALQSTTSGYPTAGGWSNKTEVDFSKTTLKEVLQNVSDDMDAVEDQASAGDITTHPCLNKKPLSIHHVNRVREVLRKDAIVYVEQQRQQQQPPGATIISRDKHNKTKRVLPSDLTLADVVEKHAIQGASGLTVKIGWLKLQGTLNIYRVSQSGKSRSTADDNCTSAASDKCGGFYNGQFTQLRDVDFEETSLAEVVAGGEDSDTMMSTTSLQLKIIPPKNWSGNQKIKKSLGGRGLEEVLPEMTLEEMKAKSLKSVGLRPNWKLEIVSFSQEEEGESSGDAGRECQRLSIFVETALEAAMKKRQSQSKLNSSSSSSAPTPLPHGPFSLDKENSTLEDLSREVSAYLGLNSSGGGSNNSTGQRFVLGGKLWDSQTHPKLKLAAVLERNNEGGNDDEERDGVNSGVTAVLVERMATASFDDPAVMESSCALPGGAYRTVSGRSSLKPAPPPQTTHYKYSIQRQD